MAKLRVGVLFGGTSGEHEISCISAAAVVDHMDADRYEVYKIGITRKGRWLLYPGGTERMRDGSWDTFADCVPAFIAPDRTNRGLVLNHGATFDIVKLEMVFPVLHGAGGEDGTVQGLLELSGIPYVGCGPLASALCMNKSTANLVFEAQGLPHTPWVAIRRADIDDFDKILFSMQGKLHFPVFVKPASSGSSIGVSKVHRPEDLRSALALAAAHDHTILLEQAVTGAEVECAVLGNEELITTLPGEIVPCNEIYDYAAKYESGDASKLYLPARLAQEKLEEVRKLATRAYRAVGCAGMARVDCFVEEDTGRVLLNEINTIPGFTPISMYPKLMAQIGIGFSDLVDRLILLAQERAEA